MKLYSNFIINLIITFSCLKINLSGGNFSLILPFTTIKKEEPELTSSFNDTITNEIMKNIFLNELFIIMEIGTPPQKIYLRLSVNSNDFFVSKEDATFQPNFPKKQKYFYYDQSKSSTFNYKYDKSSNIFFSHTHESEYVIDNIFFYSTNKKDINLNHFEFFLAHRVNGPNHGIIGLKNFPNVESRGDFLTSLKKYNLINNKIWFIEFDNYNSNGSLIIGNYPHFDSNILKTGKNKYFDLNHFVKVYSVINNQKWDKTWGLNFNKIFLQNISTNEYKEILNTNDKYKNVVLNPNFGVIIGVHSFKFLLEKIFLNKYLNNHICYQPILRLTRNYEQKAYYYYYCNSSYIEQMKNEFNPIIFEHLEFKYNFSLEFDDLFIKKNKYIYLRIIFEEYNHDWVFGSPFFNKYSLFFDSDSKEIGFYSPNINHNYLKENYGTKNSETNTNIIVHVLIGIILVIFGIYLGKKIYGLKRKLRANELEEKFEYNPAEKQMQMY